MHVGSRFTERVAIVTGGGRGIGNYGKNKTMVMAAIQRDGPIRMQSGKTHSK